MSLQQLVLWDATRAMQVFLQHRHFQLELGVLIVLLACAGQLVCKEKGSGVRTSQFSPILSLGSLAVFRCTSQCSGSLFSLCCRCSEKPSQLLWSVYVHQ